MKQNQQLEEIDRQVDSWYLEWRQISRLYIDWAARYGISDTALWLLQILCAQSGPIAQREICTQMNMPKQTVSCVLEVLEKRGVITRSRSEKDRRNSSVVLTPEGRHWTAQMLSALRDAEREAFQAINSRDRAAFTRINRLLSSRLDDALQATEEAAPFGRSYVQTPDSVKGDSC